MNTKINVFQSVTCLHLFDIRLQITRTFMKSQKFRLPLNAIINVVCFDFFIFYPILFKLAENQHMHNTLEKFELGPNSSIHLQSCSPLNSIFFSLSYNGGNVFLGIVTYFFIWTLLNLLITLTGMQFWKSSNTGQIGFIT